MLLRRLYLIEKLRDAHIVRLQTFKNCLFLIKVGLVIGATTLRGCHEAVMRLRKLCKRSGKKLYVIHIGKVEIGEGKKIM